MSSDTLDIVTAVPEASLEPEIDRDVPVRRQGNRRPIVRAFVLLAVGAAVMSGLLPLAAPPDQASRISADPETWTFMVYLDGDNDLEAVAIDDFLEMASVDSDPRLNIVVQFDRYEDIYGMGDDSRYGNWTTCKRFLISNGMTPMPAQALMDIGEVDMGDPTTLVDFLNWALGAYPADRHALVLWDHGASWYGCCWDFTDGFSVLRMDGITGALGTVQAANDQVVYDIIAFDACSMSSIEVAYDMQGYADLMMASEMWVPDDGLNYSSLQAIVDDPYITPSELCSRFLADYSAYYYGLEGTPKEYMLNESFTMSVVDLNAIGPVVEGVGLLAHELIERLCTWGEDISYARGVMEDYGGSLWDDAVDIRHMCEVFQAELPSDPEVGAVLSLLASAFDECVLDHVWGTNPENCVVPVGNTHGMAVNYPAYDVFFDQEYLDDGLCLFTEATEWDEFLECSVLGNPCVCAYLPVGDSVPTIAAVEVWFSEPVDTSRPYSVSVYPTVLGPDHSVPGTLSWDPAECKLAFTPSQPLLPFTEYTVVVSALDLQGLPVTHEWTFSTGEEIPELGSALFPVVALLSVLVALIARRARKR